MRNTPPVKNRIQWVDYAKGIGIVLVIYSHVLRGLHHTPWLSLSQEFFYYSDTFVYSFHMPLFFLLAGLFVQKSMAKTTTFFVNKLKIIVYPYFVWSLIQLGLQIVFSNHTNHIVTLRQLPEIFYAPFFQFWFLYALFIIYCVYALLHRTKNKYFILAVSLLLYLFQYYARAKIGILNTAMQYCLYFVMGALLAPTFFELSEKKSFGSPFQVISAAVVCCAVQGMLLYYRVNYALFLSIIMALLGIFMVIQLAHFLADRSRLPLLRYLGRHSLEIYVAHGIFFSGTRIALYSLVGVQDVYAHLVCGIVAGIAGPLIIVAACNRWNAYFLFRLNQRR